MKKIIKNCVPPMLVHSPFLTLESLFSILSSWIDGGRWLMIVSRKCSVIWTESLCHVEDGLFINDVPISLTLFMFSLFEITLGDHKVWTINNLDFSHKWCIPYKSCYNHQKKNDNTRTPNSFPWASVTTVIQTTKHM